MENLHYALIGSFIGLLIEILNKRRTDQEATDGSDTRDPFAKLAAKDESRSTN